LVPPRKLFVRDLVAFGFSFTPSPAIVLNLTIDPSVYLPDPVSMAPYLPKPDARNWLFAILLRIAAKAPGPIVSVIALRSALAAALRANRVEDAF
jgi:hypothetical protein